LKSIILQVENVTRRFSSQGKAAIENLSLDLHQGELLSLLGPSGCGKTTLLRLIAGFEQPQAGRICLSGSEVSCCRCNLPPEQRHVGMVFQDYALFPHLTVSQNIAFGLLSADSRSQSALQSSVPCGIAQSSSTQSSQTRSQKTRSDRPQSDQNPWIRFQSHLKSHLQAALKALLRGKPRAQGHQHRIQTMLELVGLQGLEHRYPHQLSGGQQQRVALARALAPQPQLILLDEPLSNLDLQVRLHLRQELREILKRAGTTAILVTHDQEEALSISDRIAVMHHGHLEQVGTPQQLYQQPTTRFVAEFVTQANFIPAQRRSSGWQTEIGWLEDTNEGLTQSWNAPQAELMVRQEDLLVTPHPEGIGMVEACEFLGREQRYCLQLPSGQRLKVRQTLNDIFTIGTRVALHFQSNFQLHLFSGTSLVERENGGAKDSILKYESISLMQVS